MGLEPLPERSRLLLSYRRGGSAAAPVALRERPEQLRHLAGETWLGRRLGSCAPAPAPASNRTSSPRQPASSVQLRLVAAGIGVALVPRLAALPTTGLRLLPVHPRVQRHHFALTRSSATSDPGIARIVELLEEHAARLLADSALPTG